MTTPFKNIYHLRKVADIDSQPCAFCYKPTTSVLITSDSKSDFFYTCNIHLQDVQFASPIHSQEYLYAKAKKDALDKEITILKRRWDEKNRYAGWEKLINYTKWNKNESNADETVDDKKEDKKKNVSDDKTLNDKEKADKKKLKDLSIESHEFEQILTKQPRVYALNKDIYKIRLEKKKPKPQIDTTGVKDLSMFPSVPKKALD